VVYTLKNEDHEGYPSLYRLYMETADPTEYRFACEHLDGWEHWETLSECAWFKPYITAWRRELDVRIKSLSLSRILQTASGGGRDAFQAGKYLLEGGWQGRDDRKRAGRPTKDSIRREAEKLVTVSDQIKQDYDRIMN
jgi:hypothetical protein